MGGYQVIAFYFAPVAPGFKREIGTRHVDGNASRGDFAVNGEVDGVFTSGTARAGAGLRNRYKYANADAPDSAVAGENPREKTAGAIRKTMDGRGRGGRGIHHQIAGEKPRDVKRYPRRDGGDSRGDGVDGLIGIVAARNR